MKFLVIINETHGSSELPHLASRFVIASIAAGHEVAAVFFQGEGVFNAFSDKADPASEAILKVAKDHSVPLLLCSAAMARRADLIADREPDPVFEIAGLAQMWHLAILSDRVLTF